MTPAHMAPSIVLAVSTPPSDPVNLAILAVGALAIIVAVAIAFWQRRDLRRYRQTDKTHEARRIAAELLRHERRASRESWEPVFKEIQELLLRLEDLESEARELGPLDQDVIDKSELGRIQRRLENVSDRCPQTLHDPLQAVAAAVAGFRAVVVLSDADVTNEYAKALSNSPPANLPPEIKASALGAKGIEQYKMALALHNAIGKAWDAVHTERGGES